MYRFRMLVERVEMVEVELEAETLDAALALAKEGKGKVSETHARRIQSQCCLNRTKIAE